MKSSPFQIGVIMFFSVAIVLALLIFTGVIGGSDKSKQSSVTGNVTIWGTYPTEIISKLISDFNAANQEYSVNYIPVLSGELNTKLAEAIASGVGPDIVVLNQEEILKNQSKLDRKSVV